MLTGLLIIGFLACRLLNTVNAARTQCPEEESLVDEIQGLVQLPKWPTMFSQTKVYSNPLCLSDDFRVIERECGDTWIPESAPRCSATSPRRPDHYCPPGYTVVTYKKDYVCLTVSKDKWSDTCRFSPKAFDDVDEGLVSAMVKHLKERGILISWFPIKRLDTFGPLLWTIPGPLWGSRLSVSRGFEITYGAKDKRCVVLDLNHGVRIRAESCTGDYPYLCIVEKDHFARGACPKKYYASPIPGDKRTVDLGR